MDLSKEDQLIFDAVRTIDDLLELAQITNKSGILVAIDFEKTFDFHIC